MDEGRNGRRSRGPSPNGHLSDDSSATDDSDHENGMRVGSDYQAKIPEFNPGAKADSKLDAMLVWAPHPDVPEPMLDEYSTVAKEKHGYNTEQALGMLFWHKHSVDKALTDLANFTPFPDEWTVEDKVLFEQAFSFHGKSFHRIRQMLPDKSIASLVKYYYSWKKTRSRTSLMDRQARKLAHRRQESEDEVGGSGNSDSDFENTRENGREESKNSLRTSLGAKKPDSHARLKNKRRPPRGMFLNSDDLVAVLSGPPGQAEAILKQLDAELVSLKRQVQNNKQLISMHKQKTIPGIDSWRNPDASLRINARWTNEELLLAVQGVRRYGKNFTAIAEVIGNKTEAHVRGFFVNYRRRYNLDEVLQEYQQEYGCQSAKGDEEEIGVENPKEEDSSSQSSQPSQTAANGGAELPAACSGGTTSTPPPPPPLLKEALLSQPDPAPCRDPPAGATLKPPALQQQHHQPPRMSLSPSGRTVLQQPPPLIRPNNVPPTLPTLAK